MKIPTEELKKLVLGRMCRHIFVDQLCTIILLENPRQNTNVILIGEKHTPSEESNPYAQYDVRRNVPTGQTFSEIITYTFRDIFEYTERRNNTINLSLLLEQYIPFNKNYDDQIEMEQRSGIMIIKNNLQQDYGKYIKAFDIRNTAFNYLFKEYSNAKEYYDDNIFKRYEEQQFVFEKKDKRKLYLTRTLNYIFGFTFYENNFNLLLMPFKDLISHLQNNGNENIYDNTFQHCVINNSSNVFFRDVVDNYLRITRGFRGYELECVKAYLSNKFKTAVYNAFKDINRDFFGNENVFIYEDNEEDDKINDLLRNISLFIFSYFMDLAVFYELVNPHKKDHTKIVYSGSGHTSNIMSYIEDDSPFVIETLASNDNNVDGEINCGLYTSLRTTCDTIGIGDCRKDQYFDQEQETCIPFEVDGVEETKGYS